jgi:Pretoxin HINT domain/A nuclease family of the HNH/ENDO VII superfamily with conserved AHH
MNIEPKSGEMESRLLSKSIDVNSSAIVPNQVAYASVSLELASEETAGRQPTYLRKVSNVELFGTAERKGDKGPDSELALNSQAVEFGERRNEHAPSSAVQNRRQAAAGAKFGIAKSLDYLKSLPRELVISLLLLFGCLGLIAWNGQRLDELRSEMPQATTPVSSIDPRSNTDSSVGKPSFSVPKAIFDPLKNPDWQLQTAPIESIKVGMRVPAHNPQMSDAERAQKELGIDPATWRTFTLEVDKEDGTGNVTVTLLRPSNWLVDEMQLTALSMLELMVEEAEAQRAAQPQWIQWLDEIAYQSSPDSWLDSAESIATAGTWLPLVRNSNPLQGLALASGRILEQSLTEAAADEALAAEMVAEVQSGGGIGNEIWLDIPELGAVGFAKVVANAAYTRANVDQLVRELGHLDVPNPATHRLIRLIAKREDGSRTNIELLRSLSWITENLGEDALQWAQGQGDATDDRQLHLDMPELRLNDYADVVAITACPSITEGPGEVVTATYVTDRAKVIDLTFEDSAEPIGTTAEHPFWSETRQDFVEAGKLEIGEEVLAINGQRTRLCDIAPRAGPETVYNFEVANQHVYFVTNEGLLVHNAFYVETGLRNASYWLGKNLAKGGAHVVSGGRNVIRLAQRMRELGYQAAHIVPVGKFSKRPKAVRDAIADSQAVLKKYDIDINSQANGFWAKAGHGGSHSNAYFLEMGRRLNRATNRREVEYELNALRQLLQSGAF